MERPCVTVGAYLAEWLELQRSQLQPSSWQSYRSNIECYLKPASATSHSTSWRRSGCRPSTRNSR